jgi:hypothetical protein
MDRNGKAFGFLSLPLSTAACLFELIIHSALLFGLQLLEGSTKLPLNTADQPDTHT